MKSPITTHVLDTSRGRPAEGIRVVLEREDGDGSGGFTVAGRGTTDADGRIGDLLPGDHRLDVGIYRLTFEVEPYLVERGEKGFYPAVSILFRIENPDEHYHVPLLLNPYGYSTYRGS